MHDGRLGITRIALTRGQGDLDEVLGRSGPVVGTIHRQTAAQTGEVEIHLMALVEGYIPPRTVGIGVVLDHA
ncbi:MAG TPA: hypothetical protein EYQ80_01760 [Candidatus Poseidoniales archaeon]|nr:hypothetical protein [Candidatus Poseidoniales archaeon]